MTDAYQIPTEGPWLQRYRQTLRISVWCGGILTRRRHRLFILVDDHIAGPGDWIQFDGTDFHVIPRSEVDLDG